MSYNYKTDKHQTETDFINVVSATTKKANQKPAPKNGAVNSLMVKIFWHNLQECLKYYRGCVAQGCIMRIADITESFYNNGFYSALILFNSELHFNKFCSQWNIKDYEYKRSVI